jgi:hypothetical protein
VWEKEAGVVPRTNRILITVTNVGEYEKAGFLPGRIAEVRRMK